MAKNLNIDITLQSWADIVIKKWKEKIIQMEIGSTGQLYDSFVFEIMKGAGGNLEKIDFMFKYYGRFVDMGVGKETFRGNQGEVNTTRKPKKWFSPVLYSQAIRLREILGEKYGILGAAVIKENIIQENKKYKQKRSPGGQEKRTAFPQAGERKLSVMDIYWMKKNGLL